MGLFVVMCGFVSSYNLYTGLRFTILKINGEVGFSLVPNPLSNVLPLSVLPYYSACEILIYPTTRAWQRFLLRHPKTFRRVVS
jgi:hypothetical protein